MPKRFTATEKWSDPWFRGLSPLHKLGYLYLLDNCDVAGVVDLDIVLANFQVGDTLDWEHLIEAAAGRIIRLDCGKLWLTKFIGFQYGVLTEANCMFAPIHKILEKYSLSEGALKGPPRGIHAPKVKVKEQVKVSSGKGDARGKPRVVAEMVPVPDGFDTLAVRQAIADWLSYKAKRGETYKDAAFLGRKVAEFAAAGPAAFVAAVDSSIGNSYSGIYPAKDFGNGKGTRRDNSTIGAASRERSL